MENASIKLDLDNSLVVCDGDWTISGIESLLNTTKRLPKSKDMPVSFDVSAVKNIDGAGALLMHQYINQLNTQTKQFVDIKGNQLVNKMLTLIKQNNLSQRRPSRYENSRNFLYFLGEESHRKLKEVDGFIILIGEISLKILRAFFNWRRFHFKTICHVIDNSGLKGLPIIALLSFLIGVVLAYQMGLQLETYGANIYIVYLTGMANQREFAPLITAIIVAGRTSSAFTAQIGSMKINEELDALTTMALSPVELLVLPKLLGVLLIFPILIFWSDIFCTLGAMIMAKFMLDVSYLDFLSRLKDSLGAKQFFLGLAKAPIFALIIALVGCYQGLNVKGSANSVGYQTTKSVVQAIFLIIIADALFSIVYSWCGL